MQHYIINDGVEVYPSGDGVVAVHTVNDEVHRLNETAALILEACKGVPFERIACQVRLCHPDVLTSRIDDDVQQALSLLLSKGLIRAITDRDDTVRPDSR